MRRSHQVSPAQMKSLAGLAAIAPSLVVVAVLAALRSSDGGNLHLGALAAFAIIVLCVGGGVIAMLFVALNLDADPSHHVKRAYTDWLLLPRTRRYLAASDLNFELFTERQAATLWWLNRVAMAALVVVFVWSTVIVINPANNGAAFRIVLLVAVSAMVARSFRRLVTNRQRSA